MKLLLLGIKYTIQSTFYQNTCRAMGIDVVTPDDSEQNEINRFVFEELARGISVRRPNSDSFKSFRAIQRMA